MKERTKPCIYYVSCGADCQKGIKEVSHAKVCQHCPKYRARKTGNIIKENKTAKLNKIRNREYKRECREY